MDSQPGLKSSAGPTPGFEDRAGGRRNQKTEPDAGRYQRKGAALASVGAFAQAVRS